MLWECKVEGIMPALILSASAVSMGDCTIPAHPHASSQGLTGMARVRITPFSLYSISPALRGRCTVPLAAVKLPEGAAPAGVSKTACSMCSSQDSGKPVFWSNAAALNFCVASCTAPLTQAFRQGATPPCQPDSRHVVCKRGPTTLIADLKHVPACSFSRPLLHSDTGASQNAKSSDRALDVPCWSRLRLHGRCGRMACGALRGGRCRGSAARRAPSSAWRQLGGHGRIDELVELIQECIVQISAVGFLKLLDRHVLHLHRITAASAGGPVGASF